MLLQSGSKINSDYNKHDEDDLQWHISKIKTNIRGWKECLKSEP
jgi:hypothetical protein